ncbi:methyltransferase [Roseivivax sp. THAF30]|uniref:methyltransferase n=1 Tax=Roseivivax sp. THAF30 TaxID=2587852 RepID=UPI0012690F28|nr:methyltransferase [Roseivivax sp. THAF30]QFT63340.1 Demethylspheroidene O-methyltransferase [Roseivivax sp. THAF30]
MPTPEPLKDADQISDIAFGFMGSKALFVALDLGVFSTLQGGAKTAEEIGQAAGVHGDRAATLLTALAGLGLVTVEEGRFSNSPAAEAFLVKGAKYDFGDYLRLQVGKQMYRLLDQLGPALTGELPPGATDSYETWFSDAEEARLYSESQHAGSSGPARQLAKKVDLADARHVLDVGGGTGAFAIGLCKAYPELKVTILDFPNVATLGRSYVEEAGLSDRITYAEGNAIEADWPDGVDAVLMSYLFSGVPGDAQPGLLEKAMHVLRPGGCVMIHDFIVSDSRDGPRLAALWQLQHTAFTPEARSNDTTSLAALLAEAGFADTEIDTMIPEMTMLATARKPER